MPGVAVKLKGLAALKGLATYAALALVLPGGSVVALLLWLYRRQELART